MLLFTEGWDWSTTSSHYSSLLKWTVVSAFNINTTNQRFTSGGNSANGTGRNNRWERPIGQNLESGVIGFAFRVDTAASYAMNLCTLFDGAGALGTIQIGLHLANDLQIYVFRESLSTMLGNTTFTLTPGTWHFIEFKWKIANSIASGDVEVYVDGDLKLSLAATTDTQRTANAYATHYSLCGNLPNLTSGVSQYYFDDHYLLDLTGSTNNAPLGNCRIQTLLPNGNGNSSQFVGSDGNSTDNYALVDDPAYNAGDYVDGANVNDKDTYAYGDTISSTATIYGLTVNINALKTDAGARGIKPVIRHSGTDYDGNEHTLATSATHYQQVYEQNPGTSSGWTKSGVDNAEFGMKVST